LPPSLPSFFAAWPLFEERVGASIHDFTKHVEYRGDIEGLPKGFTCPFTLKEFPLRDLPHYVCFKESASRVESLPGYSKKEAGARDMSTGLVEH
jgi:hypothetical protein